MSDSPSAAVVSAWNRQQPSPMPYSRYQRDARVFPFQPLPEREWPQQSFDRAPLWASVDLRDGNQALANPMDFDRKLAMFDLLVAVGFKDIEVGYPSSSEADFGFVRALVEQERIPADVTISVFTPARTELIDRTFDSIAGVPRAMVHLCLATACLWREVVFGLDADEVAQLTATCAEHIARRSDAMPSSALRFEYSPETFNMTEPDFALGLTDRITSVWDASPDRPVTINLPTTVETDSPTSFADQVEWMHRQVARRDSIILSVHPHNDRGTAVAAAELAVRAGADRIEGTLFGNGERTGNVCLATLALNLFSQGHDPQLDFSDIDSVRSTVEKCNQMPVHPRHPYVGELVYTAFSGTHQDAIAKGFADQERRAAAEGVSPDRTRWQVPYLPIDPHDVGRTYEAVVRLNSQSGKRGIAHVLASTYGLELPRELQTEFARSIQTLADEQMTELTPSAVWEFFQAEYVRHDDPTLIVKSHTRTATGVEVLVIRRDGSQSLLVGEGTEIGAAFADALRRDGMTVDFVGTVISSVDDGGPGRRAAAVVTLVVDGRRAFGVGVDSDSAAAVLAGVAMAVNRGAVLTCR